MLVKQQDLTQTNPFCDFICDGCGKRLGVHWLFRPERLRDVFALASGGRKPNGRLYCNRGQTAWAGSYHQRTLRRTMEPGYSPARI